MMCYQSHGVVGGTLCKRMFHHVEEIVTLTEKLDTDNPKNAEYQLG